MNNMSSMSDDDLAKIAGVKLKTSANDMSSMSDDDLAKIAGVTLKESIPQRLENAAGGFINSVYSSLPSAQSFATTHPLIAGALMPGANLLNIAPKLPQNFPLGDPNSPRYQATNEVGNLAQMIGGVKGLEGAGKSAIDDAMPYLSKFADNYAAPLVNKAGSVIQDSAGSLVNKLSNTRIGNILSGKHVSDIKNQISDLSKPGAPEQPDFQGPLQDNVISGKSVQDAHDTWSNFVKDEIVSPMYGVSPDKLGDVVGKENQLAAAEQNKNYLSSNKISRNEFDRVLDSKSHMYLDPEPVSAILKDYGDIGNLGIPRNAKSAIDIFLDDPSVINAHLAQSKIGKAMSKLQGPQYSAQDDLSLGALKDIKNHLITNLNDIVGPEYRAAQENFRMNVAIPYLDDSAFYKTAVERTPTPSLSKRFTLEEVEPKTTDALQANLKQLSPEQKEKMLLPYLNSPGKPLMTSTGDFNPDVAINGLQSLRARGVMDMLKPETQMKLQKALELKQNIAHQQAYSDYANAQLNKMNTAYAASQNSASALSKETQIQALRNRMEEEQRRTNFARMIGTGAASAIGATAGLNYLRKIF